MKKLAIWLMEYQLKTAVKSLEEETHDIVKKAKQHRVDNYRTTILFLKS